MVSALTGMGFSTAKSVRSGASKRPGAFAAARGRQLKHLSARVAPRDVRLSASLPHLRKPSARTRLRKFGSPTVANVPGRPDRLMNVLTREERNPPSGATRPATSASPRLALHEKRTGSATGSNDLEAATGGRAGVHDQLGAAAAGRETSHPGRPIRVYMAGSPGHRRGAWPLRALPQSDDIESA